MPALEFRVPGMMRRNLRHYPRYNMFQTMLPNLCLRLMIPWVRRPAARRPIVEERGTLALAWALRCEGTP